MSGDPPRPDPPYLRTMATQVSEMYQEWPRIRDTMAELGRRAEEHERRIRKLEHRVHAVSDEIEELGTGSHLVPPAPSIPSIRVEEKIDRRLTQLEAKRLAGQLTLWWKFGFAILAVALAVVTAVLVAAVRTR